MYFDGAYNASGAGYGWRIVGANREKFGEHFTRGADIKIGDAAEKEIFSEIVAQGSAHYEPQHKHHRNSFAAEVKAAFEATKALFSVLVNGKINFDARGNVVH